MTESEAELAKLQLTLGHRFAEPALLERALTHRSLLGSVLADGVLPQPLTDNEQLEYLGDAVLGMLVSEYLVRAFPDWREGQLSKGRARLVNATSLYKAAQRLGVGEYLRLGRGEIKTGGREKPALLADAFEALVAAIYLDGGLIAAREFVTRALLETAIASEGGDLGMSDHKSALQELLQGRGLPAARYKVVLETGPDHQKTFCVEVSVPEVVSATGSGTNKKRRSARLRSMRWNNSEPERTEVDEKMADAVGVAGTQADTARPQERDQTSLRELVESLLVTIILALFGTTFVVQAFKIPSQSMEPTLLVGDHLLVNKFIFGGRGHWYDVVLPYRPVRHGDIIVFKFPYQDHPHYVKRVIGLPGDRIKIVDQHVFVNGQVQIEPFAYHDPAAPYDPFLYNFPPASRDELLPNMQPEWSDQIFNYIHDGEIIVPPNKYFAMGDNRDHSWDSRYWGFVDREAIMGRPVVIYWSIRSDETEYEDRSILGGIQDTFVTLLHLPSKMRWDRLLHTVH